MAYKTILAHCNDPARMQAVLTPAVELAERFQAHLIGLSVVPPVLVLPSGVPGAPDTVVIETQRDEYRKESPRLRSALEDAARGRGMVAEWREIDAGAESVADAALDHARTADLVIAAQADPDWAGSASLDIADRLAIEAGRPVLVVPKGEGRSGIGRRVLVAWNGRREAARAAFDALPILQHAQAVKVVWVNPQSERELAQDLPAADICTALARHGVKCEATEAVRPHAGVGATLLAQAKDFGCDLLVMGCYGHSRLREFVLGGASRHVLEQSTIPVLMSH